MAQKTTTKQGPAKTVAKEEVKAKAPVKTEPVKAAEPVKKEAEAPVVNAAKNVVEGIKEKKAEKTAAKTTKKEKATKEALVPEVYIQFAGTEAVVADVTEKVKTMYVNEGHRASSIKSLQVYLKPEENAAYYVINQKTAGRVDLF
jgi:HD superfamily phosphodiesterase